MEPSNRQPNPTPEQIRERAHKIRLENLRRKIDGEDVERGRK